MLGKVFIHLFYPMLNRRKSKYGFFIFTNRSIKLQKLSFKIQMLLSPRQQQNVIVWLVVFRSEDMRNFIEVWNLIINKMLEKLNIGHETYNYKQCIAKWFSCHTKQEHYSKHSKLDVIIYGSDCSYNGRNANSRVETDWRH